MFRTEKRLAITIGAKISTLVHLSIVVCMLGFCVKLARIGIFLKCDLYNYSIHSNLNKTLSSLRLHTTLPVVLLVPLRWCRKDDSGQWSSNNHCLGIHDGVGSQENAVGNSCFLLREPLEDEAKDDKNVFTKPPTLQKGVLRTNCIDCLDRTNVAQYAYGLIALGHQLHALGFIDVPKIDQDSPLADELMCFYERMGDTLSLQYGGSAAHNKVLHIILLLYSMVNALIFSCGNGSSSVCFLLMFKSARALYFSQNISILIQTKVFLASEQAIAMIYCFSNKQLSAYFDGENSQVLMAVDLTNRLLFVWCVAFASQLTCMHAHIYIYLHMKIDVWRALSYI